MDRLPMELTLEPTRLLCYNDRHPYLHIVDIETGRDLPIPSAGDLGGAVDRVWRFDAYLVTRIGGVVVTLPEDLGDPWLDLGAGSPHRALDPSLLWLLSRTRKRAVLMTRDGHRKRVVATGADDVLAIAEVAGGLLLMIDNAVVLLTPDGEMRDPGVWADLEMFESSPDGIVGIRRAERHRVLRFDLDGSVSGGAEVDPGMSWARGALTPSLRHFAGPVREMRADLSLEERRRLKWNFRVDKSFVLADLDTGRVTEIACAPHEPNHLMYGIWNRAADRFFGCDPFDDELVTFSVHDPVLRRASEDRIRSGPLIELTDQARETGLPTDLVTVTQARSAAGGGPRRVRTTEPALGKIEQLRADPGLAGVADTVAALARPSIRLGVEYRPPAGVRSRFGGRPDLPADMSWPQGGEVPLAFLAQLDLAEVAAVASVGLPTHGLLSFWFDSRPDFVVGDSPGDDRFWRVLHLSGHVATREPPPGLRPCSAYHCSTVTLREEVTIPAPELIVPALGLSPAEVLRYDMIAGPAVGPAHRLLGHPDADRGGDMAKTCQRLASDRRPSNGRPPPSSNSSPAEPWTLLCQFDSDSGTGFDWNGGRLYFWIRLDDLRHGLLSRVWVVHEIDC